MRNWVRNWVGSWRPLSRYIVGFNLASFLWLWVCLACSHFRLLVIIATVNGVSCTVWLLTERGQQPPEKKPPRYPHWP